MRKNVLHILFSITMVSVFAIYASGISIVKHTCHSCDITNYSLFTQEHNTCCEDTESDACSIESMGESCCTPKSSNHEGIISFNGEKCCTYDSFYFALTHNYTLTQARQNIIHPTTINYFLPGLLLHQNEIISAGNHHPAHLNTPFSLPYSSCGGVEFLIFTHQLKIDCTETFIS